MYFTSIIQLLSVAASTMERTTTRGWRSTSRATRSATACSGRGSVDPGDAPLSPTSDSLTQSTAGRYPTPTTPSAAPWSSATRALMTRQTQVMHHGTLFHFPLLFRYFLPQFITNNTIKYRDSSDLVSTHKRTVPLSYESITVKV